MAPAQSVLLALRQLSETTVANSALASRGVWMTRICAPLQWYAASRWLDNGADPGLRILTVCGEGCPCRTNTSRSRKQSGTQP